MKSNKNIYTAIEEAVQTFLDRCDYLHTNPTLNICEEVEGELEGVGLVVADFEGTVEVSNYSYDSGSYWTPPDLYYDAKYKGKLTYYEEDGTPHSIDVEGWA